MTMYGPVADGQAAPTRWESGRRLLLRSGLGLAAAPGLRGIASAQSSARPEPLLIFIFLRGGMDGLHFLSPSDDARFNDLRAADLRNHSSGDLAGHRLDASPAVDFRLHRQAGALARIWGEGRMAIWPAAGLPQQTRSHFDAQRLMGFGDGRPVRGAALDRPGWLAQWLAPGDATVRAVAAQVRLPAELQGATSAQALPPLDGGLPLPGGAFGSDMLRALHAGVPGVVAEAGRKALAGLSSIDLLLPRDAAGRIAAYRPAADVDYGRLGGFGRSLRTVAQLAKIHPGLAVAAIDLDNWDMHEGQAGRMANEMRLLSEGLGALDRDLASLTRPWRVLVASEFGRRLRNNRSGGTDHGRAGTIFSFRGQQAGAEQLGRHFGPWPGLEDGALEDGVDLAIASDYRQVFHTVLRDLAPQRRSPFTAL